VNLAIWLICVADAHFVNGVRHQHLNHLRRHQNQQPHQRPQVEVVLYVLHRRAPTADQTAAALKMLHSALASVMTAGRGLVAAGGRKLVETYGTKWQETTLVVIAFPG